MPRKLRAIDLYGGIGGWALGLRCAGIEVISSYEWWESAAETAKQNLDCKVHIEDIRKLDPKSLPKSIDIVVGSPPCVEFSYSNRGGSGDISDGLVDIRKFLEVVRSVRPRFWAMENVPRVQQVLLRELRPGGELSEFRKLLRDDQILVVDMSEFGLPQRRKRCIAGNISFELLLAYRQVCKETSLANAIEPLDQKTIVDVNFGQKHKHAELTEHIKEPPLDWEEIRFNFEAKRFHPVYNDMAFPEPRNRPVRTVTATCTRVSRESVIVQDQVKSDAFRRLTVRERALLQGFPFSYQFFGKSYAEKLRMIGNAIPPVFTYYVGQAMREVPLKSLVTLPNAGCSHERPVKSPVHTTPDKEGRAYPATRRFWFAIPNLRFKSGTRFDLKNSVSGGAIHWQVNFYYGPSTAIQSFPLDNTALTRVLKENWGKAFTNALKKVSAQIKLLDARFSPETLQRMWTTKGDRTQHPFALIDELGEVAKSLIDAFPKEHIEHASRVILELARQYSDDAEVKGERKLSTYSDKILAGIVVGSVFNCHFASSRERLAAE